MEICFLLGKTTFLGKQKLLCYQKPAKNLHAGHLIVCFRNVRKTASVLPPFWATDSFYLATCGVSFRVSS